MTQTVTATDIVIEAQDLTKHFPVTEGVLLRRTIGQVKAVDGISFQDTPWGDIQLGRRVRLRQDHDR